MLSLRLERIVDSVPACESVADIGTDHGYVPIALAKRGDVKHIIGMDIRPKPLEKARNNIKAEKLEEYIELRLSDGAQKLSKGEAEVIVVSGMGGELVADIMKAGAAVFKSAKLMVLSPQSELMEFRSFLIDNEYRIIDEELVFEEGKYYFILKVSNEKENDEYQKAELMYGRQLLLRKSSELKSFIIKEKKLQEGILELLLDKDSESAVQRRKECINKLEIIEDALAAYR